MENKLLEWAKDKCIEVQQLYEFYKMYREKVKEMADDIQRSSFYNEAIGRDVQTMNIYFAKYSQGKRDISQVCHVLGGEYLEIFNQYIREEDGGESNDA